MNKLIEKNFCLVYQAGIANVYEVERISIMADARGKTFLLYQGGFNEASMMAQGMCYAGAKVRTFACNKAGDIREATWDTDLFDCPFHGGFRIITSK